MRPWLIEAIYRGPTLKPGTSYRLVISWDLHDAGNENKIVTDRIKPGGDSKNLECIWLRPSGGKRFFVRLPTQVTIKVQHHHAHVIWKDSEASIFTWDCSMNTQATDTVLGATKGSSQLILTAAIVGHIGADQAAPATVPSSPADASAAPQVNLLVPHEIADAVEAVSRSIPAKSPDPIVNTVDHMNETLAPVQSLASTLSNGFPTLLNTLEGFMKIGGLLANACYYLPN
ncbi:hypothetical protein DL93DRAFT_612012 [Clavulina sp. PMI_390]|nr:hypothetical protein DL93DRAFT_612012 [Clavulina sp. PMI_390]